MNNFKRNLLIGYGFILFLLLVSSVVSYVSISNLLTSQQWVNHTHEVILKLENTFSSIKDAETGQRGFLLTGNPDYLTPYNGAHDKTMNLIRDLRQLTADNPVQLDDCDSLNAMALQRLNRLAVNIEAKRKGITITDSMLSMGKEQMQHTRNIMNRMINREKILLADRTKDLNRFTGITPIIIIIASLFAIVITIISLVRLVKDFDKRNALQQALIKKDEEIQKRVTAIQAIAEQISKGNYTLSIDDKGKDDLGNIAGSLNTMANSLDEAFSSLKNKEWQQTGIVQLNELMISEKNVHLLTSQVIEFICTYTRSQGGLFFIAHENFQLELSATYAIAKNEVNQLLHWGDGIIGQTAVTGTGIHLHSLSENDLQINYAAGSIRPRSILSFPVFHERSLKGVIELISLDDFDNITKEFLQLAAFNIGLALQSAQNHTRLQQLLEETQAQAEELQAQHSELENLNTELEAQTQRLQASEEELRVQQEELQQANAELEERARLLEELNQDIAERNIEIQHKAAELEQSTRYKSEFLANMSHELRTPLNSILLLSRLMAENPQQNLDAEQVEYAQVIQSSGQGLLSLIDEILDLSKIEAGKMILEYERIPLDSITTNMRSLFEPVAKDKGLSFSVEIEKTTTPTIDIDKLRLEQILKNLIANALKFTAHGTVSLVVKQKDAAHIAFTVTDTGVGIPKEKQALIFDAFQQADGSTRRKFGGTGLGLSISRELARLLGGTIQLESEPGKGSAFTVIVPVIKPVITASNEAATTVAVVPNEPEKEVPVVLPDRYTTTTIPTNIPDDRSSITAGDKTLLIIDDDTAFAKALLDFTHKKGYKGIVAVRGDEGIELARQFKPLGILLDVQLPVKSGWEVMEELKKNPSTRHIPVHMMSSFQVKNESLMKGAVDFVNKPLAFEQMQQVFKKIEHVLTKESKKVLIVEENSKHAKALAYFLETFNVNSEVKNDVNESITALQGDVDCVILDMGIPDQKTYNMLEYVKQQQGLEHLPIIIFTGKSLSMAEEQRIKKYADSIVVKTAHSYQRILDEVSLFLHLVEENKKPSRQPGDKKLGMLNDVIKNKTVLVVDDDVRNVFSLTRALEKLDVTVITALNGKDALQKLEDTPAIDIVLLDMMMPEMDGYETATKIRQHREWKDLPIIAVTAKAMTGDREKCVKAGASDYITKPVDIDQLVSLLRVWLYEKK